MTAEQYGDFHAKPAPNEDLDKQVEREIEEDKGVTETLLDEYHTLASSIKQVGS